MTGTAAFPARPQRRKALLLALLVLAQLLATAHGKQQPRPADDGALHAVTLAGAAAEPAAPFSRRLPQRFRDPALAEADALARIAANQPADLIVSFKVSRSDIKQQESQIANSLGLVAGDVAPPAAAQPLRREARMRANLAVKQRVVMEREARKGARIKRDFAMLPVALLTVNSSEALEALRSNPSVASIEPRIMFSIAGRGLPDLPPLARGFGGGAVDALGVDGGGGGRRRLLLEESLPMIGAPEAAAAGYTGKGCAVAVIDTGADYTQPDLGSCTEPGQPAATCRVSAAHDIHLSDDYDDGELDDSGHGTNVASIVARAATESQIIALDVFRWFDDPSGGQFLSADYADIVGAIDWVLEKKDELGICVINMSLGSPCLSSGNTKIGCPACPDRAIAQALASARAAGVLAAVASGNDGLSTGLSIPACAPAAVSVGAVYDAAVAGGLAWGRNPVTCIDRTIVKEQIACFSNSASYLTAIAPGAMITAGGSVMGGTSQASPHVAATLAVLRAAFKNATLDAAVEALTTTGKALTDPRNSVTKPLINMLQAANKMAEGASIPVGTVRINGGAQWTSSRTVSLAIQSSGAPWMCVTSEAAASCAQYEPYATSKAWQLSDGDGDKSVFVYFRNARGETSTPAMATITLDSTPPVNAALTIDGGAEFTSSPQVTLAIGGTDTYPAGLQMCVANHDTGSGGCSPYEPFETSKSHTLTAGDGPKTVFLWLRDAAGNTASAQAQITLLVAPSGSVAINGGAAWTNTPSVTLSITAGEGVTEVCVANTAVGAAACQIWEATPAEARPWQLPQGDGEKGVFVYFRNAGNETSAPATATITLDSTPPVNAALTIDGGTEFTSSPQVTLAIGGTDNYPAGLQMCVANHDTGSGGCSPYELFAPSKNHALFAGDGPKTVFLWLRDAAGNTAAPAQAQIMLLSTPTGYLNINGGAAWTNTPSVTLSITSSVAVTNFCVSNAAVGAAACVLWEAPAASKAWQLPDGDGEKGVFVYFTNAGGETSGPAMATITLDSTPPVNASLTINGGAEWAADTDVTLAIGGSDNYPAGLQMCLSATQTAAAGVCTPYEAFAASKVWQLPAGEGERTVFLWLRDAAGSSAGASASIKLDTQAPSGVAVSINDGAAETASLDVSVTITASDFSGVASMCIKMAAGALCSEGDFLAFASPAAVKLLGGRTGPRYVYVTLRDARGNTMSAPASDQITYNDPSVPSDVTVSVANVNSNGWVTSSDVRIAVSGAGAASVTEICVREEDAPCTAFSPFVNPMPYLLSSGPDGNRTLFVTLRAAAAAAAAAVAAAAPANGTLSALCGGFGLTLPLYFMADLNPPTDTSVSLSGGTGATATTHVLLTVAATDVSGVKAVCIAANPEATAASCQLWQPYSTSQPFTLASAEGTSTVLAFFRDANGHTSAGVAASVTVDTSKPKAVKRAMDLKAAASSSSITLTWSKDGATDDISYVLSFYVLYRPRTAPNNCEKMSKKTKLVNAAVGAGRTVTATVRDLESGRRYGFRVCPVDAAGNVGGGVAMHASTTSVAGTLGRP